MPNYGRMPETFSLSPFRRATSGDHAPAAFTTRWHAIAPLLVCTTKPPERALVYSA